MLRSHLRLLRSRSVSFGLPDHPTHFARRFRPFRCGPDDRAPQKVRRAVADQIAAARHREIVGRIAAEGNAISDLDAGVERLGRSIHIEPGLVGPRFALAVSSIRMNGRRSVIGVFPPVAHKRMSRGRTGET